jgi:hypothetical protein
MEEVVRDFVNSFDWKTGLMGMHQTMSNRAIVAALDLTRGGSIKHASAMQQVRRWTNAISGETTKQTRNPTPGVQDAFKRAAAADQLGGSPIQIEGDIAIEYDESDAGTRHVDSSNLRQDDGTRGVVPSAGLADLVLKGDYAKAGEQLGADIMSAYGAPDLTIVSMSNVHIEY